MFLAKNRHAFVLIFNLQLFLLLGLVYKNKYKFILNKEGHNVTYFLLFF